MSVYECKHTMIHQIIIPSYMTQQATVYFTSSILDIHPHLWLHLSCLARRILLVSSWAMSCFICVGSKECSFVMCGDGTEGLASWTSSVPNIVLQHKIYITWWLNRNHAEPIEDFYVILSMMHCNVRIIISAPSIFHKSLLNNECHVLPKNGPDYWDMSWLEASSVIYLT